MNGAKVFLGSSKDLAASVDVSLLEIAPIAIGLASTVELLGYKCIEWAVSLRSTSWSDLLASVKSKDNALSVLNGPPMTKKIGRFSQFILVKLGVLLN